MKPAADVTANRLSALDRMRGFVMILMITDHASSSFNAHRPWKDSVHFFDPAEYPTTVEFLFRWMSHLCAPTFVFLAGTSLAISIQRRLDRGVDHRAIDKDLLIRGLMIFAVEILVIGWLYPDFLLFQVMYAIGLSMIAMIVLRRLNPAVLVGAAVVILAGYEAVFLDRGMVPVDPMTAGRIVNAMLLSAGMMPTSLQDVDAFKAVFVAYPVIPWLAIMLLGWGFGRLLCRWDGAPDRDRRAARLLMLSGVVSLILFAVVRGANGYGNLSLPRLDGSVMEWLRVSKYPPSLSYVALELGCMALLLSCFFRLQLFAKWAPGPKSVLLVFGQTAFFFYVLHIPALDLAARALGMHKAAGLTAAVVASLIGLVVLYPLCRVYRQLKRAHPKSILRYW